MANLSSSALNKINNLLYEFSIPLGLTYMLQTVIANTQDDPNAPDIPVMRAPREWFSQPAPCSGGATPKVTVYLCDDTHNLLDINGQGVIPLPTNPIMATISALLDANAINLQTVIWPDALIPLGASIQQGVQALAAAIQANPGPFILVGNGQGAAVASLVLEQIQSGYLTHYQQYLLAGVTFGNVCRQLGRCAPVQRDPGGCGIWGDHLITDTPDFWWDFALPGDNACCITPEGDTPTSDYGTDATTLFEVVMDTFNGGDVHQFVINNPLRLPDDIVVNLPNMKHYIDFVGIVAGCVVPQDDPDFLSLGSHHDYWHTSPPGSDGSTCAQLAANYINQTAQKWQADYVFVPRIEVLTINLRQPSTVSSLSFQALSVPCQLQVWYRDRHHNWVPMTDTSNSPISININYSAVTDWFSYKNDVYSVIATAIQFRIQRNPKALSQLGNSPYVVGLKNVLASRNVFNLTDTVMALEAQQDSLGNNIAAYVKDWQPQNAIDNNPGLYWKSFPSPDPMGVVAFYMDIRDASGDSQLVDTLYIDPVYSGSSLNIYYSTDSTQGTLVISPVNLPPDVQINTSWIQGAGMLDNSPVPAIPLSKLLFPVSFGPFVQAPIWIGIGWAPNFSAASPPNVNPILFGVNPGIDAIQDITINGSPTGGTFTITDWNNEVTSAIAYDAPASAVQTALEGLTSIGSGNVSVFAAANGGPYIVTFINHLARQAIITMTASGANLTGGTDPSVTVVTSTIGLPVPNPSSDLYWPIVYYDTIAGEIVLEFTNGTNTVTYGAALSPELEANVHYEIVVGWAYDPDTVFISVTTQNGTQSIDSTVFSSPGVPYTLPFFIGTGVSNLPPNITLDGEVGYTNFCGLMDALVVKQDLWSNGYQAFQGATSIYANPGPVQPNVNGTYPSTTLDNAILAVDWTTQQYPIGGTSESWYENKMWTPIFANYITQKGPLYFPQKVNASYLKLEFYNLTPEPYPVYDQGISITYDTFPISVLSVGAGSTTSSNQSSSPLTLTSNIISNSIGSVNWFNPQSIQNAINSNWGMTQWPVQVTSGPGTLTQSLPNVSQSNISASYRSEQSNPWIYRRRILNPTYLAGQYLNQTRNGSRNQVHQSALSSVAPAIGSGTNGASSSTTNTVTGSLSANANATPQIFSTNFSPVITTSKSNVLSQMGANWWLFPGANLKMPASLMRQLTGTSTVVARGPSVGSDYRFTTTCVHRYSTQTLTLDAAVAYFAGLSEVQAYCSSYISSNDPVSFNYSQYDPSTFTYDNITQLPLGPLTTSGSPYQLENPNFLYTLELSPWTATGAWYWDSLNGIGNSFTSGGVPSAAIVADANPNTLVSEPLPVSPGDEILVTAYVSYYNALSVSGGELSISLVTYNNGTSSATSLSMPTTTATYTVLTQADMLATGASEYQSCTITEATGGYQGTYTLIGSDPTVFANWTFTGYGTYVNEPTGNIDGELFIGLTGTYTVPGTGVDHIAVSLNVNSGVIEGNIYWDDISVDPVAGIEGTVYLNAVTTATFADLTVNVSDSGLVNSDSMWARLDPLDTNIANLQLAPYVTTIPDVIPAGFWDDSVATWDSMTIDWGEPVSEVAIQLDPNVIFNGNRAMHFTRVAGAGEAGIEVTQQTNLTPQELCQIGCVFYKTAANTNQLQVSLVRVSDGVVIHTETFTPVVGYWFTYLSAFFELPDTWDQVYTLQFVATGDEADELYLSDLFLNVAGARYFVQLGGDEEFLFDCTPLVYGGYANVSCTLPVNEFSLTVGIFNPNFYCFGINLTPHYLGG